jgi:gas vesicle protein
MKRILTILSVLGAASALNLLAQQGPGPGPGGPGAGNTFSNDYNWNHSWSNYFNQSNSYQWGTNLYRMSNAPAPRAWSNAFQHAVGTPNQAGQPGNPDQARQRFGQPELPADVQARVQQFQQDRQRLMNQLKTCSDDQRKQILQEMEQLRNQWRDQVAQIREQAQQQAVQMRDRLGNDRNRMLQNGAGNNGGGNGGGNGGRDR